MDPPGATLRFDRKDRLRLWWSRDEQKIQEDETGRQRQQQQRGITTRSNKNRDFIQRPPRGGGGGGERNNNDNTGAAATERVAAYFQRQSPLTTTCLPSSSSGETTTSSSAEQETTDQSSVPSTAAREKDHAEDPISPTGVNEDIDIGADGASYPASSFDSSSSSSSSVGAVAEEPSTRHQVVVGTTSQKAALQHQYNRRSQDVPRHPRPRQRRPRRPDHPWRADMTLSSAATAHHHHSRHSWRRLVKQQRDHLPLDEPPALKSLARETSLVAIKEQQPWDEPPPPSSSSLNRMMMMTTTTTRETTTTTSLTRNASSSAGKPDTVVIFEEDEDEEEEDNSSVPEKEQQQQQQLDHHLTELKQRLEQVYTGDHVCIEASGKGGFGGSDNMRTPKEDQTIQEQRSQLVTALNQRLELLYTSDQGCIETLGGCNNSSKVSGESKANQAAISTTKDNEDDDCDCWTEYTCHDETVAEECNNNNNNEVDLNRRRDMLAAFLEKKRDSSGSSSRELVQDERLGSNTAAATGVVAEDDDDDCWTEYTWCEETVADTRSMMRPPLATSADAKVGADAETTAKELKQEDAERSMIDDDCWTEYTCEDTIVDAQVGRRSSIDMPATVTEDDCWTEYTCEETVADALQVNNKQTIAATPAANFASTNDDDAVQETARSNVVDGDDCWTEYTCEETVADACTGKKQSIDIKPTKKVIEDDCWTEYTCEETVADVPFPFPNQLVIDSRPSILVARGQESKDSAPDALEDNEPAMSMSGVLGQKSITEILRREIWSRDATVVEAALLCLSQKADENAENRANIVRFGGLLAIVRAMEVNLANARIQVSACRALERMALDKDNHSAIGGVGAVEAILAAMTAHLDNASVQTAALSTLLNLTNHISTNQMVVKATAIDAIVSSMEVHADVPKIQEDAFRTLANLCLENNERLMALSEVGGFVVMAAALQEKWENPALKREAVSTLSTLFGRLAEQNDN